VARDQSDYARAEALLQEALAEFGELGNRLGVAAVLQTLGAVAAGRGDHAPARALLEEALATFRELDAHLYTAACLHHLATVAQDEGDTGRATSLLAESLMLRQTDGDRRGVAECLESLAQVAGARDQGETAVRLFGAAEALRETIGAPLPPAARPAYVRALAAARAAVGPERFAGAWTAGRALTAEQAIALALQTATVAPPTSPAHGASPPAGAERA
jgi:ATP/maltotriose-dependent transcriptional regulator MalT